MVTLLRDFAAEEDEAQAVERACDRDQGREDLVREDLDPRDLS